LIVGAYTALVVGVMAFVPPLPQSQDYHAFADRRTSLGIPNVGDVLSNVPFAVVGLWGLIAVYGSASGDAFRGRVWAAPYAVFFASVAIVALGSAYYHWSPNNATLVWDRLPMSAAFMAIVAAAIADRIGEKPARVLLVPLIACGLASVLYWAATDDLRPYFLIQFLSIPLIVAMCWFLPARRALKFHTVAGLIGGYVLAKVFEAVDVAVWEATGHIVSGHSLKHIVAALSCIFLIAAVRDSAYEPGS
jgi:hypothetical protein